MITQIQSNVPRGNDSLVQCAISGRDPLPQPYQRAASDGQGKIKLEVRADRTFVKITQPTGMTQLRQGGGSAKRGCITGFSQRARGRMMRAVADLRGKGKQTFLTLTYNDAVWFGENLNPRDLQRHLENLSHRLMRLGVDVKILWRKEWATRKSGEHVGEVAPHIHILIQGVSLTNKKFRKWLWSAWHEITTEKDTTRLPKSRVDVQVAHSRKHAYYYLSKYVAKPDEIDSASDNDEEMIDISPLKKFFNDHAGSIGRHWGLRGNWDRSSSLVVELTHEQFLQIRREVRKWVSRRNRRFGRVMAGMGEHVGFSVFGLGDEPEEPPPGGIAVLRLLEYHVWQL